MTKDLRITKKANKREDLWKDAAASIGCSNASPVICIFFSYFAFN
jgi:hypothetical protein